MQCNLQKVMGFWKGGFRAKAILFCVLAHLECLVEGTKSKHIDEMIEASKNQRTASFKCHVCHSETNAGCFNFTENGDDFEGFPEECWEKDKLACVVKKFAFTSTDKNGTTSQMSTFAVKRNCSKSCEDGCVVMGERTRIYVCSQCCRTPLCNIGSGSTSIHYQHVEYYIKILLSYLARIPKVIGHLCGMTYLSEIASLQIPHISF